MIELEINKDIEEYKIGMFKGLTAGELIFAALTVGVGTAVTIGCNYIMKVPIEVAIYFAIPIAAPFALTGFYQYNGMSFWEKMKRMFVVTYSSTYPYATEEEFLLESMIMEANRPEKKLHKTKLSNKFKRKGNRK